MGNCDVVVNELCKRAEWKLEHGMIPENQQVDIQLANDHDSRWQFRTRKPETTQGPAETSEPPKIQEDDGFVHIDHISPPNSERKAPKEADLVHAEVTNA